MCVIERLIAATALFVGAHFAMGYLNPSAGGSGGALIFPFASNAGSSWAFGALDGGPFVLLIPIMIGLAGIAVLARWTARIGLGGRSSNRSSTSPGMRL
jgi:hypothetical protein